MATRKTMAIKSDWVTQEYNGRPVGMPDPEWPWPWKTDDERDAAIRTPYWQARFRQHAAKYLAYAKFIIGKRKDVDNAEVSADVAGQLEAHDKPRARKV